MNEEPCSQEWTYKKDSNAAYGGTHILRCTTCDEVIVSGSVGNGAGFRYLTYAGHEAWKEHIARRSEMEKKTYREWVPILEAEKQVEVIDPDGARSVYWKGLQDTPMSKKQAEEFFARDTVGYLVAAGHLKQIEMFICWPDKTWEIRLICIPADTPEDRIEGVAWIVTEQQLQKRGLKAAFFGVYSIPEE